MRTVASYVETGVGMATDHGVAAWTFEPDLWGLCGQGPDEESALADLRAAIPGEVGLRVAERIEGDEGIFARDRLPSRVDERLATLWILVAVRPRTIALVESCPPELLDWDDPTRELPSYAHWRTLRQMAWHITDTECRYYLPRLGWGYRERAADLSTELRESYTYVVTAVVDMPADLVRVDSGEVWTSRKLLRRLAWHERGELAVMRQMATRGRAALGLVGP